jgi:hypothetical protein
LRRHRFAALPQQGSVAVGAATGGVIFTGTPIDREIADRFI